MTSEEGPTFEQQQAWYNFTAPGTEGIKSVSDPDWNWSWHNPAMVRRGPSKKLQDQIRQFKRRFGPPPDDMEFYGTFDDAARLSLDSESEGDGNDQPQPGT
jgi:hypothetical protein